MPPALSLLAGLTDGQELKGVPEDVIGGYKQEGDKYIVTFKTPDIFPIFKFAQNPETRKRANLGYEAKTAVNTPLLDEIIKLRRKAANLLGYENWAEWILEVKMAKSSKNVMDFLNDLLKQLKPIGMAEREKLLQIKKEECEANGLAFDGKLALWDYRYYDRLYVEKACSLDEELVKEYFPVAVVVPAVLEIYRQLLNVEFEQVPKDQGGKTWHEGASSRLDTNKADRRGTDAEMYAVWDGGEGDKKGEFLGYMHLDLFPRANKYGHAGALIPFVELAIRLMILESRVWTHSWLYRC